MPYIAKDFVKNQLLPRVDIVKLIQQFRTLKRSGSNYTCCCPFHNEKTPSFMVSPSRQTFKCFGCGVGGNALDFVMRYKNEGFVEAVEELSKFAGLEVVYEKGSNRAEYAHRESQNLKYYELMERVANFFSAQLKNNSEAYEYFTKKRELTEDTISKARLGYAPMDYDYVSKLCQHPDDFKRFVALGIQTERTLDNGRRTSRAFFMNRVIFPIFDVKGRIVAFGGRLLSGDKGPKYLNSPETPIFKKRRELFGLYECLKQTRNRPECIVVVEGYMDAIALRQAGFDYVVATLGTAITADHYELLFRYTSKIVCCFDGDEAGSRATWRALQTVAPVLQQDKDVRFITMPSGHDPDTLVRTGGKEAFEKLLADSVSYPESILVHEYAFHDVSDPNQRVIFINKVLSIAKALTLDTMRQVLIQTLSTFVSLPMSALLSMFENVQPDRSFMRSLDAAEPDNDYSGRWGAGMGMGYGHGHGHGYGGNQGSQVPAQVLSGPAGMVNPQYRGSTAAYYQQPMNATLPAGQGGAIGPVQLQDQPQMPPMQQQIGPASLAPRVDDYTLASMPPQLSPEQSNGRYRFSPPSSGMHRGYNLGGKGYQQRPYNRGFGGYNRRPWRSEGNYGWSLDYNGDSGPKVYTADPRADELSTLAPRWASTSDTHPQFRQNANYQTAQRLTQMQQMANMPASQQQVNMVSPQALVPDEHGYTYPPFVPPTSVAVTAQAPAQALAKVPQASLGPSQGLGQSPGQSLGQNLGQSPEPVAVPPVVSTVVATQDKTQAARGHGVMLTVEQLQERARKELVQQRSQTPGGSYMELGPNGAPMVSSDQEDEDTGEYYEGGRGPGRMDSSRVGANQAGAAANAKGGVIDPQGVFGSGVAGQAAAAGDYAARPLTYEELTKYPTVLNKNFTPLDLDPLEYNIIAFILQNPNLVDMVYDKFNMDQFLLIAKAIRLREYPIFERLLHLIRRNPSITCGALIEEFRGSDFEVLFNYLLDVRILKCKENGEEFDSDVKVGYLSRWLFDVVIHHMKEVMNNAQLAGDDIDMQEAMNLNSLMKLSYDDVSRQKQLQELKAKHYKPRTVGSQSGGVLVSQASTQLASASPSAQKAQGTSDAQGSSGAQGAQGTPVAAAPAAMSLTQKQIDKSES